MNKLYPFAKLSLALTATLALGLVAAGCSDDDDAYYPPTGSVTFKYVLEGVAPRTLISKDVDRIQYSFTDKDGHIVFVSKAYDPKHNNMASVDGHITVSGVPLAATGVTAAYFDLAKTSQNQEQERLLSIGWNEIDWQRQYQVVVEDPEIVEVVPGEVTFAILPSNYTLAPGQDFWVGLSLTPSDKAYDYDVTSFVNFVTVETEELIEARRDYEHDKSPGSYPTPGYFKAIALGEQTLRATLELPSETLQLECLITITNEERP